MLGNTKKPDKFLFEGMDFSTSFLWSRLVLIILSMFLLFVVSFLFHRFGEKRRNQKKSKKIRSIDRGLTKDVDLLKSLCF